MEVHVHSVPKQTTENGLKKFLKPKLLSLSIQVFDCRKPRDRDFAKLTFLNAGDGNRFLALYGQAKPKPFPRVVSQVQLAKLVFHNQPIYCEQSRYRANSQLLRCLQKELKDLESKALAGGESFREQTVANPTFDVSAVSCGTWTYVNSNLAFSSEFQLSGHGEAKFKESIMILKFESGERIDIRYSSTVAMTTDDGPEPSLTFTLQEAPKFFRKIDMFDIFLGLGLEARKGPTQNRLSGFDEGHERVAGICLVYRLKLSRKASGEIASAFQTLRKARGMPPMIDHPTEVCLAGESYATGLDKLKAELATLTDGLPFLVAFQVQRLTQNGFLSPRQVSLLLPEISCMTQRSTIKVCVSAIRRFSNKIPFPGSEIDAKQFDVETLVEQLRICEEQSNNFPDDVVAGLNSGNIAIIHRVSVTPAGIYLYGPEPETNNRVLRKYSDHHENFIRVQFSDEDGEPVRFGADTSNDEIFNVRFRKILREGIDIAGRTFEFLGFSHSSLRAQSCWFVTPFFHNGDLLYDRAIIHDLGDFSLIRSPAKCAARIGQAFSDTATAVTLNRGVQTSMEDLERNDRVFSDGVGTMSLSVMHQIWDALPQKHLSKPTCFQIRYCGAKGMISLDSRLEGDALRLRPSMIKFDGSTSTDLELCGGAYKPLPMFLNRQFIKILEDLGVEDSFFLHLQRQEVDRLRKITQSPFNASTFLQRESIGDAVHLPWFINKLSSLNLDFRNDAFLRDVLEMSVLIELRRLKHKTRIPVEKGYHLHGLMDETGILGEGQVFCSVMVEGMVNVITGKDLVITRAPALHPGDIQLVDAVTVPEDSPLRWLHNCICFSQKGARDLPSQLGGGDLDGDTYYLMWDKRAKLKRVVKPADYPRVAPIDIGRIVNRNDMTDFFVRFMEQDQLGRIATLHQILADQKDDGTLDPHCIILAELHSAAVDFSKTGISADILRIPKYNPYRPDFTAPGPHVEIESREGIDFDEPSEILKPMDDDDDQPAVRYYESHKVLGKLYRDIDEREVFRQIKQNASAISRKDRVPVMDNVWAYVQQKCKSVKYEHFVSWAEDLRDTYDDCVLNAMTEYSHHPKRQLKEMEVFIGNILGRTGAQSKKQKDLSKSLKERFSEDASFIVNCIVKDGLYYSTDSLARSIACLAASRQERAGWKGTEPLQSFKYVAASICLREVDFWMSET